MLQNKKLTVSVYIRQILTLMTGTLIAQAITFAFIPVITRLYSPEEFGAFALFLSTVSIFGLISSLKYDQAIMLPKKEEDAQALLFLSIALTLITVITLVVGLLFFSDSLINYFGGNHNLMWLIPYGVLLTGTLQVLNAYSSRKQHYKKLANVKVINSFVVASSQTGAKSLFNLNGLAFGKLLADSFSVFLLAKSYFSMNISHLKMMSKEEIAVNAKLYKDFPKFQCPTVFLNSISQNLPVFMFAYFFSPEIAGYYALTVKVLQVPISLIGKSTREVFYQKASKIYASNESFYELYFTTTLGLFKIFIIPFCIIFIGGEQLFTLYLGDAWGVSGKMSQILVFWFMFIFINPPSIMSLSILRLQKVQMQLEIISLLLRFLSIYAGYFFFQSVFAALYLFVISSIFVNLYIIIFVYYRLKKESQ
jgi:lipopolysaccharide exporter